MNIRIFLDEVYNSEFCKEPFAEGTTLNSTRPINLNLLSLRFPITAITSILHRVTGVVLFLSIPYALWILAHSLQSETDFVYVSLTLQKPLFKWLNWLILSALAYHLTAGIRHILADFGLGISKQGGKQAAWVTLAIALLLSISIGVWVC